MSGEVISLDSFRKTAVAQNIEPVKKANIMEGFTPETQSDAMANDLVLGLYQGLKNVGIDPQADVNNEVLELIYEMTLAITDRHFDVFNDVNAERDIQAEHGEPFYVVHAAIRNDDGED